MKKSALLAALAVLASVPSFAAEEPPACPLHAAHSKAEAELDQRGDRVMGLDHTRTTHHFKIEPDGGIIQVEANDAADAESRQAIRTHLAEIAGAFSRGDFSAPFAIHQRVMPGIPILIEKKEAVRYLYEETERGAQVRIATQDPGAVAAVHEFLRAQIGDHRTGDPLHNHAQ
jgi:hypothetical protein